MVLSVQAEISRQPLDGFAIKFSSDIHGTKNMNLMDVVGSEFSFSATMKLIFIFSKISSQLSDGLT